MHESGDDRPIWTIGHSTRSIAEFVDLLRGGKVEMVVDVRTIPRSRTNPQYNLDFLPSALADYQIGNRYIAALGGLKGRSHHVPPDLNAFWTNRSFHNYADYTLSDAFAAGLEELIAIATDRRAAIMCSEAVWWRCHRRLIADQLILRGIPVFHLMDRGKVVPASITPGAEQRGGKLVYPARTED